MKETRIQGRVVLKESDFTVLLYSIASPYYRRQDETAPEKSREVLTVTHNRALLTVLAQVQANRMAYLVSVIPEVLPYFRVGHLCHLDLRPESGCAIKSGSTCISSSHEGVSPHCTQ